MGARVVIDGNRDVWFSTDLPFVYDAKRSFWKNAQELQEIIRKRAEMLDTSAIDMELFDPSYQ